MFTLLFLLQAKIDCNELIFLNDDEQVEELPVPFDDEETDDDSLADEYDDGGDDTDSGDNPSRYTNFNHTWQAWFDNWITLSYTYTIVNKVTDSSPVQ